MRDGRRCFLYLIFDVAALSAGLKGRLISPPLCHLVSDCLTDTPTVACT